jgi:hypothetical protein
LLHLEGKGRSKYTIEAVAKNLKLLAQRADLNNPTEVELAIARYRKKNGQPASNNYKSKLCDHYNWFCKTYGIQWEKPIYTSEERSIQPPSDEKCSMLIASARNPLSRSIEVSSRGNFHSYYIDH